MLAYVLTDKGGLSSLKQVERPDPRPGPGEVLVAVRAVSLNYRDLVVAEALLGGDKPSDLIPVSDGAGEVIAVGEGVSRHKVGDRVVASFMRGWIEGPLTPEKQATSLGGNDVQGMLAERVVLPAEAVLPIPGHLSYEEAATLPCAALTVWNAMFEHGDLKPGQTVLLLGTGGVSIFGLQFARAVGARAIITSSSDRKLEQARKLGAWQTINYRTHPNWQDEVLRHTDGQGVDMTIEVGGPGTMNRSLVATRYGGTVALMGVLTGAVDQVETVWILHRNLRVQGIYVGSVAMFERMNAAIAENGIRPVIHEVVPFAEARRAYDLLQSGNHFGKIVISVRS